MEGVKLAIVGSLYFTYALWREAATRIINEEIDKLEPVLIISGGADGIDKLGESIALQRGIAFHPYYPVNKQWEPSGYKDRNFLIAGACTHMLCIRSKTSTTYGSGWTADMAKLMLKPVRIELL